MSISVEHLYKSYGKQLVLNDISFSIGTGEIVAFLGNNGAGKSTTMKIITGYLEPDSGDVEVCGINVRKNPLESNRKIGYLPEHNPIYPDMFVKEYLMFIAGVYKLGKASEERVDEMIEKTGLTREYKKKIGMLSKGYRQRVGLAPLMGLTGESLMDAILNERRLELAFEGSRFFDLIRFGKLIPVMNSLNSRDEGRVPQARPFVENHRLMPIPQTALDQNVNLKQNPGY